MRTFLPLAVLAAACSTAESPLSEADGDLTARDPASGLATGRRQHAMLIQAMQDLDALEERLSALETENAALREIVSPRDPASGLPTGRTIRDDLDDLAAEFHEVKSPRDVATGQATGRTIRDDLYDLVDAFAAVEGVVSPRDVASGLPTGRTLRDDLDDLAETVAYHGQIVSPRDPASGQATGRTLRDDVTDLYAAVDFLEAEAALAGDGITLERLADDTAWRRIRVIGPDMEPDLSTVVIEADVDGDGEYEALGMLGDRDGDNKVEVYRYVVGGARGPATER
jgi:hypothetical protein